MIDNMFAIMKRINEIRGRFGIGQNRQAIPGNNRADTTGYQEMQDRAVAKARDSEIAGIKGKTVEEIGKLADHFAKARKVPPALVRAVIEAESGFNPDAVSPKGAKGLMQLMPSVVSDMGVDNPFDPAENINAGVGLLKDLLTEYNGDYTKALAAYNAGRKAVNESGGVPDYPETREYVKKVIEAYVKNSQ
jgi:soluble lytic murein transglycosylase-like protein